MKLEPIDTQRTIEAERFVLRPLRRSDRGLVEMNGADKRVARMTRSIPHPLPPGVTEDFIARAMAPERTEDVWAIDGTRADLPEVMGLIALERMDRNQSEVGYWVAPAFWNTGIASDAVRALVEANPQDSDTLFASVFQDNPASAKVLTNCGFEYIGDAESYSLARDTTVPTWTYLRKMTR